MAGELDIEDVGFITIRVRGADGTAVEVGGLDLFQMSIHIAALGRQHPGVDGSQPFLRAVVEYMQTLGFPEVSLYVADAFCRRINTQVAELQKKSPDATTPGLPASTT